MKNTQQNILISIQSILTSPIIFLLTSALILATLITSLNSQQTPKTPTHVFLQSQSLSSLVASPKTYTLTSTPSSSFTSLTPSTLSTIFTPDEIATLLTHQTLSTFISSYQITSSQIDSQNNRIIFYIVDPDYSLQTYQNLSTQIMNIYSPYFKLDTSSVIQDEQVNYVTKSILADTGIEDYLESSPLPESTQNGLQIVLRIRSNDTTEIETLELINGQIKYEKE